MASDPQRVPRFADIWRLHVVTSNETQSCGPYASRFAQATALSVPLAETDWKKSAPQVAMLTTGSDGNNQVPPSNPYQVYCLLPLAWPDRALRSLDLSYVLRSAPAFYRLTCSSPGSKHFPHCSRGGFFACRTGNFLSCLGPFRGQRPDRGAGVSWCAFAERSPPHGRPFRALR